MFLVNTNSHHLKNIFYAESGNKYEPIFVINILQQHSIDNLQYGLYAEESCIVTEI